MDTRGAAERIVSGRRIERLGCSHRAASVRGGDDHLEENPLGFLPGCFRLRWTDLGRAREKRRGRGNGLSPGIERADVSPLFSSFFISLFKIQFQICFE
jgi:hypothetical protein